MFNRSRDTVHPCLVPDFKENAPEIYSLKIIYVSFFVSSLYQVKDVSF